MSLAKSSVNYRTVQRSGSKLVSSNIRKYFRLQLLIEVLVRIDRILEENDKQFIGKQLGLYLKEGTDKYIYGLKANQLPHELEKPGKVHYNCDDILIVINGCITDSFAANPIFFDGKKWWTPDTPLLAGTQRAWLIEEEKLLVCSIPVNDLSKYKKAGLINAMQNFEDMPIIDIENIFILPNCNRKKIREAQVFRSQE
ncbi:MAG: aminotransferase class IV [Prolixibacteraceae bacterium]|nr:aminotransferase class IV [Prolixibacteraceae bacterium]